MRRPDGRLAAVAGVVLMLSTRSSKAEKVDPASKFALNIAGSDSTKGTATIEIGDTPKYFALDISPPDSSSGDGVVLHASIGYFSCNDAICMGNEGTSGWAHVATLRMPTQNGSHAFVTYFVRDVGQDVIIARRCGDKKCSETKQTIKLIVTVGRLK